MTTGDELPEVTPQPEQEVKPAAAEKKSILKVPRPTNAVDPLEAPPPDWEKAKPDNNHYLGEKPKSRL